MLIGGNGKINSRLIAPTSKRCHSRRPAFAVPVDCLDFAGLLVLFEIVDVNFILVGRPLSLLFGYTLQTYGSVCAILQIVRKIDVEADERIRAGAGEIANAGLFAIIYKSSIAARFTSPVSSSFLRASAATRSRSR